MKCKSNTFSLEKLEKTNKKHLSNRTSAFAIFYSAELLFLFPCLTINVANHTHGTTESYIIGRFILI